jgi:hypothetical protein
VTIDRYKNNYCGDERVTTTFLGYNISADGIKPPAERVTAITNFSQPTTSTEMRRFLGMINFFRHMIPHFAEIAYPLTELIKKHPSSKKLPWTTDEDTAFIEVKQALASCPTLAFPIPQSSRYQIVSDSSSYAVGAALYQMINNKPTSVSFFSKKLSATEKKLTPLMNENFLQLISQFLILKLSLMDTLLIYSLIINQSFRRSTQKPLPSPNVNSVNCHFFLSTYRQYIISKVTITS